MCSIGMEISFEELTSGLQLPAQYGGRTSNGVGEASCLNSSSASIAGIQRFGYRGKKLRSISELRRVDLVAIPGTAGDAIPIEERSFDREKPPVQTVDVGSTLA